MIFFFRVKKKKKPKWKCEAIYRELKRIWQTWKVSCDSVAQPCEKLLLLFVIRGFGYNTDPGKEKRTVFRLQTGAYLKLRFTHQTWNVNVLPSMKALVNLSLSSEWSKCIVRTSIILSSTIMGLGFKFVLLEEYRNSQAEKLTYKSF